MARMAAMARALPDRVVPMPDWPGPIRAAAASIRSDSSALTPQTAAGTPPAMALPITSMSGSRPCGRA
jgi:hypothetical protein